MRCLPAAKPLRMLNGRFRCWPRTAPDPEESFTASAVQRQVIERSSRTDQKLTGCCSAKADLGPPARIGRQYVAYPPFSRNGNQWPL